MLDNLNSISKETLVKDIKIPKKQAEEIINKIPLVRLWHLSKIEGVGNKSYEKIFEYLYKKTNEYLSNQKDNKSEVIDNICEQLSLF